MYKGCLNCQGGAGIILGGLGPWHAPLASCWITYASLDPVICVEAVERLRKHSDFLP